MMFLKNLKKWGVNMKLSKFFVIFLISLFLISGGLSLEINSPETLRRDETFLAQISGNFANPLLEENIFLYRGHVRVASEFELIFVNDIYYLATPLLGKVPGNYSVRIEDATYFEGNNLIEKDIVLEFKISEDQADYSLSPGVIYTKDNFEIKIKNMRSSTLQVTLTLFEYQRDSSSNDLSDEQTVFEALFNEDSSSVSEREVESTSINLKSGEIKHLPFKAEDFRNDSLRKIRFSSENTEYSLPIFVFLNKSLSSSKSKISARFEPAIENISMITDSEKTLIFHFFNDGEDTLKNITFAVSETFKPYVNLSLEYLKNLEKNSSITLEAYISSPDKQVSVEGFILASSDLRDVADSELVLNFIKDYVAPEEPESPEEPLISPEEKSSVWRWIGIIILIAIILFGIWFYFKKYKSSKIKPNILERAKRNLQKR
jgi:hypothetical protein